MTWAITTPLSSESEKLGDDRIREAKADFQTALQVESIFPGPDVNNPIARRAILKGTTAQRPAATAAYAGRWYFNSTTKNIQRNTSAPVWEDITPSYDIIPSGATMVFYQSSAPSGWAQITTLNDSTLRVVSGSGLGVGGTDSVSVPPTHAHGSGNTVTKSTSHSHAFPYTVATMANNGSSFAVTNADTITFAPETVPHTHSLPSTSLQPWTPGYIDVIIATKT